jgi:hypothetical protein
MKNIKFKNFTVKVSILILTLLSSVVLLSSSINSYAGPNGEVLVDTYEVIDTSNEMQLWSIEEQVIAEAQSGMGMNDTVQDWTASQVMAMATTTEPTITTGMKNSKGFLSKLKKALKGIARFIKKIIKVIGKIVGIIRQQCRVVSIVSDGMDSRTICGIFVPQGTQIP